MDLVDEQHVAILEIGEQRRQIARFGDDGAGSGAKSHPQLARDDLRERGLAEPRGAEEEDMIERLAARLGGLDEHPEIFTRGALADEFVEPLGAQRGVDILGLARGREDAVGVSHRPPSRHAELVSASTAPRTLQQWLESRRHREVRPIGILAFDEVDLPLPVPALELLLARDRFRQGREELVVDETMGRRSAR